MPTRHEISSFIGSTFRSVWALELLCFLRRNRDRDLSHAEMVAELRASDLVVTRSLKSLTAAGLVQCEPDGVARYCPATPALDDLAGIAQSAYASSPDAMRRMIANPAPCIEAVAEPNPLTQV